MGEERKTMSVGYRKRRSQSLSSDEETDEKRFRRHHMIGQERVPLDYWSKYKPMRNRKTKSTVLVLDCKRLRDDVMLLMYSIASYQWFNLPMAYKMVEIEEPQSFMTAKNLIGFVRSAVIFWKDDQTLISANLSKASIQCFPSMGTGRCYSSSKWKYICALNQLFAVNIYNTGETDSHFETAVVNIMTYSFKDEGWEKLAEHRMKKRIRSIPFVLGTEGTDCLWLCMADYYINPQNLKLQKHSLHILSIENHTWGLHALDCSDLSELYGTNQYFPSLSTNSQGHLCVYIEPVVYTYAMDTAHWSERKLETVDSMESSSSALLAETKILTGLKRFMFKMDKAKDTCEFHCCDLETGESVEEDVPPINIFQRAPHLGRVIQQQTFRISNVIGNSKLASYRVSDHILKKARDTDSEQFECEF